MGKPFLTYDEQIKKLKEKGMIIQDDNAAMHMLKCYSYFSMISGYKEPFKNKDGSYKKGTTIEDVYALYKFDENLRHIFLEYILIVERKIKSLLSYVFSEEFGFSQYAYLNTGNFDYNNNNPNKIQEINKLITILTEKTSPPFQYKYMEHQSNKHNNIPLWVAIKTLTFGNISKMYSLSLQKIKTQVSKEFVGVRENDIERMIDVLSRFRNICAHDERLYDYRLNRKEIPNTRLHTELEIKKSNGKYLQGKNDLFAVLISLKYLIEIDELKELCQKVDLEICEITTVSKLLPRDMILKKMGFPQNWKDITSSQ